MIHDPTIQDSSINYAFFCMPWTDWSKGKKLQVGLHSIFSKQKAAKITLISFQQCTSCFTTRDILFVLRINLCNLQSKYSLIALGCCKKYTSDARHILHTFMQIVPEAPGILFQKNQKCVKKLSKFMRMSGIDNRLIFSSSWNHKIPENT